MHKRKFQHLLAALALSILLPSSAAALPLSHFANTSRLSSGRWVKIAVDNDGVYELSFEELSAMGFSDPSRVAIYGDGGHAIGETLNGTSPDDLQPVASKLLDGKLYFYGKGPVQMLLDRENTSSITAFRRVLNVYSNHGYYFLTEEDAPVRVQELVDAGTIGSSTLTSSYAYWYHERDLVTLSQSGKELLGEDMLNNDIALQFELPGMCDTRAVVAANCAGYTQRRGDNIDIVGNVRYGGTTYPVGFLVTRARIYSSTDEGPVYSTAMPHASFTFNKIISSGEFVLSLKNSSANPSTPITIARLDHAIITYHRINAFASAEEAQFDMWYDYLSTSQTLALNLQGTPSAEVWDVTQPSTPVSYTPTMGDTQATITPGRNVTMPHFVVFDPSKPQHKVSGFETVANQNLHGLPVPDLLIVTHRDFHDQALRIANLHRSHDGMVVHVVDQDEVFNEFSSGTPDAMAVRLLCKMFYDRNSSQFKNLLLFGPGLYDNRQITTTKPYALITYESDLSNNVLRSNATDDFFGFLADNSGSAIQRELLSIGVGRMIPRNPTEAKNDVDKLIEYVTSTDYGVWRNNSLLIGDQGSSSVGDVGLHVFQAEGINDIIETTKSNPMHINKVYIETFPRDNTETLVNADRRTCTEGKHHLIESFSAGQYFTTYIGHAGGTVMSGGSKLWYSNDVNSNHYANWPIMTTACCNVARFDNNGEGIAEAMYHQRQGGAIALLTSARDVASDKNDELNRAFVTAMFNTALDYTTPTLGEVYRDAKRSFGTDTEYNKLSFFLLGDPAIKVNLPRTLFTVTSINGSAVDASSNIEVSPMQMVTVEADVLTPDGNVDESFNGEATLTLYGDKRYYTTYTMNVRQGTWSVPVTRNIYYERPMFAQMQGNVVSGHFTGNVIVPRNEQPGEGPMQLSLYAHKAGSEEMVNGTFDNLTLTDYDEAQAAVDNSAPVVEAMYLNNAQTFAQDATVGSDAVLYVVATDDLGFNTQSNSPGGSVRVSLDGNAKEYLCAKDYITCSDGGRRLELAMPVSGLAMGRHTLTFATQDVSGKPVSQSITFSVASTSALTIDVNERPADTKATFEVTANSLSSIPSVDLKVTDAQGRLVWSTTTSTFPVAWDLTNADGNRVPAGVYKFFGTYNDGVNYGGTSVRQLIVIDPLTASKQ